MGAQLSVEKIQEEIAYIKVNLVRHSNRIGTVPNVPTTLT